MDEVPQITATLVFVREPSRILLGMKKRGFGAGRWNGFGGKVQPGESVETAARRELLEESGLTAAELVPAGELLFVLRGRPFTMKAHIFRVTEYQGEPQETEEMQPQWFALDEIPFDAMWTDDRYWMPLFLRGERFRGTFTLDENDQIVDHELTPTP